MAKPDPASAATRILRLRDGAREEVEDLLAVEEPLEIRLGYTDAQKGRVHRSIAITMRTPGDDVELALGFLHAENILRARDEVASIDASRANVLRLELREDVRVDALRLERHFYTTSSCGICGKASLEALSLAGYEPVVNAGFRISSKLLMQVPDALRAQQALFSRTGGNHATGLFDMDGQVLRIREDVGRHNAMDKLIGSLLQEDALPLQGHGIVVSGRASFELLQKALAARCPILLAVGAPSSLAVELAREFDITLAGFAGERGFNVYHDAGRLTD